MSPKNLRLYGTSESKDTANLISKQTPKNTIQFKENCFPRNSEKLNSVTSIATA